MSIFLSALIAVAVLLLTASPGYIFVKKKFVSDQCMSFFKAFPLPTVAKQVFYIIAACPAASIFLNFSELIGEGWQEAVWSVLMTTVLSVVTLPLMMPMLQFFN